VLAGDLRPGAYRVGTTIAGHAGEQVALEVDQIDEALCRGRSVLVRGPAHRVAHPAELDRLQEDP
jgi:hypothetical protein